MWHRCLVRLPTLHLEIESIGKAGLKQTEKKARISVQVQSVESNVIELYWHIINGASQIDIDSENPTVDICGL